MDLMNAINASIENDDLGNGLWIKKQYDYIDNGDLQKCIRRTSYQNIASSSSGVPMECNKVGHYQILLRRDYINNGGIMRVTFLAQIINNCTVHTWLIEGPESVIRDDPKYSDIY
ncbi:hypothetical protein RhiirC2_868166 [Rhizophagus irregularis]|uniref:Uncharacterized protein n=1 Tax=Rhizophagus irregularis TaxID=588596 RepID=A0A2N1MYK5_9GLOM|nr:hypothetical protein RhiirC2_868166 [Rhizophagus irregularis]